jgi:hypothetical protein
MKTVPVMIIALGAMSTPTAAFTPRVLHTQTVPRNFGLGATTDQSSEGIRTPSGMVISHDEINRTHDEINRTNVLKKLAAETMAAAKKASETDGDRARLFSKAAPETKVPEKKTGVKKPSKELTGVDPSLTEICATISKQIYDAKSKEDFDLTGAIEQLTEAHSFLHEALSYNRKE